MTNTNRPTLTFSITWLLVSLVVFPANILSGFTGMQMTHTSPASLTAVISPAA